LGVNIDITSEGDINLTQQVLIKSILKDLGLNENSKSRRTPALSSKKLHSQQEILPINETWSYRMVIGKLNY
jgi:hypothetical protein